MGCHALLQGGLLNSGIEPRSPAMQVDSLLSEPYLPTISHSWCFLFFLFSKSKFPSGIIYFQSEQLLYLFHFWAALGLCRTGLSLVAGSRGCSLAVVRGLLIVGASVVAEHRLQGTRPAVVWRLGSRAQTQ